MIRIKDLDFPGTGLPGTFTYTVEEEKPDDEILPDFLVAILNAEIDQMVEEGADRDQATDEVYQRVGL